MSNHAEASLLARVDLLQFLKRASAAGIKDLTLSLKALFFAHDDIIVSYKIAGSYAYLPLLPIWSLVFTHR